MSRKTLTVAASPARSDVRIDVAPPTERVAAALPALAAPYGAAAEASSLRAAMGEILRTVTAPGVPAEVAIGGVRRIARGALGVGDEA